MLFKRIWLIPISTIFLLLLLDVIFISHIDEIPSLYKKSHTVQFPSFQAMDLHGGTVSQEIFKGKFSIVCLWVTQDSKASRDLFSELSLWQSSASKQPQIIGIVGDLRDTDSPEHIESVRNLIRDFPQKIPQLLVNDDLTDFLQRIRSAPTICFVNEKGELIGQPVAGNEISLIQKEAERLMETDSDKYQLGIKIQNSLFQQP